MNKQTKKFWVASTPYFAIALIVALAGSFMISILYPRQPQPMNFTWDGVLMFLTICAGLGWIVHGVGFLFMKVSK